MCRYHKCLSTKIFSLNYIVDLFYVNITRRQEPAQSPAPAMDYDYTFDGMNCLSSGEDESQTYDELSNLVTKGDAKYTYQDPDDEGGDQMRLAEFNDGTEHEYTYDDNGNPIEVTDRFSELNYDNLNLLRSIEHTQIDEYVYNSADLRVKKTEDTGGTPKTTYTLFDGINPLMQETYQGATRVQTTFNIIVNGQILAQYKRVYPSTDSVVYFYMDYLGSRRVVIDASSGTATNRYRYSAWGVATQDFGSDDYRSFTGKQYDATGLIYFNARYYDPVTGRFLTEDPARKGISWYGYCENNPLVYVDPRGMVELETDTETGEVYGIIEQNDMLTQIALDLTGNAVNWKKLGLTEEQARNIKPGDRINITQLIDPKIIALLKMQADAEKNGMISPYRNIFNLLLDPNAPNCYATAVEILVIPVPGWDERTYMHEKEMYYVISKLHIRTSDPKTGDLITFGKETGIDIDPLTHAGIYLLTSKSGKQYIFSQEGRGAPYRIRERKELETFKKSKWTGDVYYGSKIKFYSK